MGGSGRNFRNLAWITASDAPLRELRNPDSLPSRAVVRPPRSRESREDVHRPANTRKDTIDSTRCQVHRRRRGDRWAPSSQSTGGNMRKACLTSPTFEVWEAMQDSFVWCGSFWGPCTQAPTTCHEKELCTRIETVDSRRTHQKNMKMFPGGLFIA